jgi:hypothetical protein
MSWIITLRVLAQKEGESMKQIAQNQNSTGYKYYSGDQKITRKKQTR